VQYNVAASAAASAAAASAAAAAAAFADVQAVIARYGAWEVDDAQPVLVELREVPGDHTTASSSSSGGSSSGGSGSQIEIVITDRGNGIPAAQAAHMYDYFWSNNKATNTLWVQ
jgi:signal transduction histidine kinase